MGRNLITFYCPAKGTSWHARPSKTQISLCSLCSQGSNGRKTKTLVRMFGCLDTCQFVPYTLDAGSKYKMVNLIIILFISVYEGLRMYAKMISLLVFIDFSLTVKAAPHECVIRTGQP